MTARSKGHHEIPKWLLKHFCWDKGKTLWMGSKDTREVKAVVLKDAFRRNDANTRIDYQSRGCGKPRRIKSDLDEKILGKFDDKADRAACRLSNTLEADSCVDALEEALSRDLPGVFNTDQGSQFTSEAFTSVLVAHGVSISMDSVGSYMDNVFVERLWRSVKYEEVYLKAYESVAEARVGIGAYLRFYNSERPHRSSLRTSGPRPL